MEYIIVVLFSHSSLHNHYLLVNYSTFIVMYNLHLLVLACATRGHTVLLELPIGLSKGNLSCVGDIKIEKRVLEFAQSKPKTTFNNTFPVQIFDS